jgi:hypothetical protein
VLSSRILCLAFCFFAGRPALSLESLSEDALSSVSGQSFFISDYVRNDNFGYYRLGIDAEVGINANIRRMALGCDNPGGVGPCDIALNNVRFAGVSASSSSDSGPATDFLLRRPYIEFAIKNPASNAVREISGFRIGAFEALGRLSVGENPDINDVSDDTGIESVSGFMVATLTNTQLTNVGVTSLGICCIIGPTTAVVSSHTAALTLNRSSTITIGNIEAVAAGLTLSNAWINNEPLNNIHDILVAADASGTVPTKDFYISSQKEVLQWQNISNGQFGGTVNTTYQGNPSTAVIPSAQKGWWMYVPQVQLPDVISNQSIRIGTLDAIAGLFGSRVDIDPVDLQQRPIDNCWGGLTFC